MCRSGTQEFSSGLYPFYWTKNWRPRPWLRTLSRQRMVYMGPPSTSRGDGGALAGGWRSDVTYGLIREMWNAGWMQHRGGGRPRRTAVVVRTRVMGKGPMYRGASLEQVVRRGISRANNQTFWPTERWGAGRRWSANIFISLTVFRMVRRAALHTRWMSTCRGRNVHLLLLLREEQRLVPQTAGDKPVGETSKLL